MMIWYKNSILASIFSLAGCAGVIAGIGELMDAQNSEMSIAEIICCIAASLLVAFIGNRISTHKAKKKHAQTSQPAASSASNGAAYTQSRHTSAYTDQQADSSEPVKTSIVAAGILLTLVLLFKYLNDSRIPDAIAYISSDSVLEYVMYLLLAIAAFHTCATQQISIGYVIGFLGLCLPRIKEAVYYFSHGGSAGLIYNYAVNGGINAMQALAFLLMALLAFFAMKMKNTGGKGIVRALWWMPALLLLFSYAMKLIDGSQSILHILQSIGWVGLENMFRHPAYLTILTMFSSFFAVLLMGICFRRFCKVPEISYPPFAAYAQAAPQYEAPVPPYQTQQSRPTQPRPANAPARPAAVSADQTEAEKMREAYKDLLEMGILTPEEYHQKMRELH